MYYRDNNSSGGAFIFILIAVLIILIFIEHIHGSDVYNNGVCTYCGSTYEFQQAVGHQYFTDYIYVCNKCGRLIQIPDYYPPK